MPTLFPFHDANASALPMALWSLAAVAALLAAAALARAAECGMWSRMRLETPRRTAWETAFLMLLTGVAVQHGGSKNAVPSASATNAVCGSDGGAGRPALPDGQVNGISAGRDVPVAPCANGTAATVDGNALSSGSASATSAIADDAPGLRFTGIERSGGSTVLAVAWPAGTSFAGGAVDLLAGAGPAAADWCRVARIDVSGAVSNEAAFALPDDELPEGLRGGAAFFRLSAQTCEEAEEAADTDGDGLPDGWEVDNGFDPLSADGADGASGDMDGDGLCNHDERLLGTDPRSPDTDGDGVSDRTEILEGSDPTDASDAGRPTPGYPNRGFLFNVYGDYAAWRMDVAALGPGEVGTTRSMSMASPGVSNERLLVLRKGDSYRLTMEWLNSDGHVNPNWYCWQAKVDGLPTSPSYGNYSSGRLEGNETVVGRRWLAENADGLLTSHVHKRDGSGGGGNVAEGLEATLRVYRCEVRICSPDGDEWEELEESRVLLDDEDLRIRATMTPAVDSFDLCRRAFGSNLLVSTSGTCPAAVAIELSESDFMQFGDHSEIRVSRTRAQLAELGLLPSKDDDGVDEMAWMDMADLSPGTGQDLSDSLAFAELALEDRGRACTDASMTLESIPPNSAPSESYFKAAGREVVCAEYGGVRSRRRQIMNQADFFYFSGHGAHASGELQGRLSAATAGKWWTRDLDVAVLAGCSVLDVNDYNVNFPDPVDHAMSPGKKWEQAGPSVLLGYNYYAPADAGGVPARIVRSWAARRTSMGDVDAWMKANEDNHAWNACAIVTGEKYVYFDSFMSVIHFKKTIKKENW